MSLEQDAVETPGIANKAVESKYEVVYTGYGEAVGCSASICSQQYISWTAPPSADRVVASRYLARTCLVLT